MQFAINYKISTFKRKFLNYIKIFKFDFLREFDTENKLNKLNQLFLT
jgi:hypothetical protein